MEKNDDVDEWVDPEDATNSIFNFDDNDDKDNEDDEDADDDIFDVFDLVDDDEY